jgi:hypothetical protein
MKKLTYEDYLADPSAVTARIQLGAQRDRARAVQRYLLAPLARFCGRLLAIRGVKLRLDPRAAASRGVFQ